MCLPSWNRSTSRKNVVCRYDGVALDLPSVYSIITDKLKKHSTAICVGALAENNVLIYLRKVDTKKVPMLEIKNPNGDVVVPLTYKFKKTGEWVQWPCAEP